MWTDKAICECGFVTECPFGDLFHVHITCCPDCGKSKEEFRVAIARWKSDSKWWNPFTWGKTKLEYLKMKN